MKIRYENTIDDMVAFNRFHCERSPAIRRARRSATFSLALIVILIAAIFALVLKEPFPLIVGSLGALYLAAMMPGAYRRQMDRQVRRMYAEGRNKRMHVPHVLELTEHELIEWTKYSETRMSLETIEEVASNGDYTIIYLSAVFALVVPHDAVSEGNVDAFVAELKKRLASTEIHFDGESE